MITIVLVLIACALTALLQNMKHKKEIAELRQDLEKELEEKQRQFSQHTRETENLFQQTISALSEAVDAKDRYTSGHSRRVAFYAKKMAERMGKNEAEQEEIYQAGLLHDVGKIRIPDEIINKAGKLTDEEYNHIKLHPVSGYHILRDISMNHCFSEGARFHHERYDGKGYPNGLIGKDIPEIARIIGVADAYDAMASNRSYRKALPQDVVRSEIVKGRGTQFDPDIADIMLEMIDEDKDYLMKQNDLECKKVLIVDDEPINIKLVRFAMKNEPEYELLSANSGAHALEVLKKEQVRLVLLDLHMPEMNGFETLAKMREFTQVPVVFMTATKDLETIKKADSMGVSDYVTKPFLPLALREVIYSMTK